jgi:hypothetical protein
MLTSLHGSQKILFFLFFNLPPAGEMINEKRLVYPKGSGLKKIVP